MHVICTAGHVDHGKSALVRALTGIEPDRLSEERRRGLTIDIGFAWTEIDGATVAFVDLPGHERFIANMLAGAGAARLALFVVAADEGWMPQSAEHLAILDLLEFDAGVVALTRVDLVDGETRDIAEELLRAELAGTVLSNAPIVGVSSVTGAGVDDVRAALSQLVAAVAPPEDVQRPRLWVDRSFSVAGAGTVVTGTLAGGVLRSGDEVTVVPGGRRVRIRGLQQLHVTVQAAEPGRVAVNVANVGRTQIRRGDALVAGPWQEATTVDAWARSLGDRPIRGKGAWHLHAGSAERQVQVRPLEGEVGPSGGMVRLRFDPPLPLAPGDRFVLRESGARQTVGGGVVLDPDAPRTLRGRTSRQRRQEQLEVRHRALASGDPQRLVRAAAAERGAVSSARLGALTGLSDALAAAGSAGLVPLGGAWADPDAFDRWRTATVTWLEEFHAGEPLAAGAPRARLGGVVTGAGCPPAFADAALDALVSAGVLVTDGPSFRLPGHRVVLDETQTVVRDRLLTALEKDAFNPPDLEDAARDAGADTALLRALEADGDLVRLTGRVAFTGAALVRAIELLRALHAEHGPFTAGQARERLGSTRKFVVPLLEELDRRGVTRRVGDRRELR